ncbi:uncharacterized protein LOC135113066 [Scylla paramamosain]|uniref:uncharacterized protein LOC135113066 n=1 Tax=Scylla paramamosain TaxID=85552 RepID=UPI003083C203
MKDPAREQNPHHHHITTTTTTTATTTTMKSLAGVLFCAFLAFVSGHHGDDGTVNCHCGFLAVTHYGLVEVDFPHEHIANCDLVTECSNICKETWTKVMGDGNLNSISETPGETVGQGLCNRLTKRGLKNFGPYKVHGYRSLCQESLKNDGYVSVQELCCKEGQHTECTGDEVFPHGSLHVHEYTHTHNHTHSHGDHTHSHPHDHDHDHTHTHRRR